MTLEEGHRLALKILKEVMEEKVDENNIQLAQVRIRNRVLVSRNPSLTCATSLQVVRADNNEAKFEILSGEATKALIAAM
jgi:20S proteasome alpha/beta subunit